MPCREHEAPLGIAEIMSRRLPHGPDMLGRGVHLHRAGGIIMLVFSIADRARRSPRSLSPYASINEKALLPSVSFHSFRLFFIAEITIGPYRQKIYQNCDHVPCDHWSRSNQNPIVDPEDLKSAHDCRHHWVHTRARLTLEHADQIRHGSKGCSHTRQKAEDL
jgi:hypothetical protein